MESVRVNGPNMSRDTILRSLDFLARSGMDQVRLLGGEPTLHPEFEWLVDLVQERGMRLLVFSNGLVPGAALSKLERLSAERVAVLVNINSPDEQKPGELDSQTATLRRLGDRVTLGLNIHKPAPQLEFLLDIIQEFGLADVIRLGLAHPCIEGKNTFLPPKQYEEVGRHLLTFSELAEQRGVRLEFDCGFVPCMFPGNDMPKVEGIFESVGQRCNPILDILPNGQVVPCYPLAAVCSAPLPEARDAGWLRSRFQEKLRQYRSIGVFRECGICQLRQAQKCTGGCLAAAMQRLRHVPFVVDLPQNLSEES